MFEFEACEVFKIKKFTFVNDCFKDEHNRRTERSEYVNTIKNKQLMNKSDIMDKHLLLLI